MAIRVQNGAALSFGVMEAQVRVTHTRVRRGTTGQIVRTDALSSAVNVAAGERLRIPSGDIDIVYPDGELERDHMDALVKAYWDGEDFAVDCLTAANTVVADDGYEQQVHSGWTFTKEAD